MTGGLGKLSILVLGGSKGIGLATARLLSEGGARVGLVARGADPLRRAAAEIGGTAFVADLSSPESVSRLGDEVGRNFGGAPDVLVNSAGVFGIASFLETSLEVVEAQLNGNLLPAFLGIRAFLPEMLSRGSGHIVNVGSIAARVALPGNAAYSVSKFALRGLHEVLAVELQGSGVRTTMIEPAATDTPLWDALDPDTRNDLPNRSQMMRPEAVARAIVFAISQPADVEISYLAVRAAG